MKRPTRLKVLSLLLVLCLLLHCLPAMQVTAVEEPAPSDSALPATEPAQPLTEQCRILDHVDADVFASGNHVARLPEEEQLYSYVFQNADGSKTVYYMDQAVKFVDANGIIQEKNLTLTAVASDLTPNAMGITPTAGYTTASNDVGLYLPMSPADGIRLNYGAKYVTVIPQGGDSGVTASVDGGSIVYRDYYGPGMSLVYTPSLSGVKEDIVLSAYTGVTAFTFTLRTNGLNLYQANGRYFLAASKTATERFDLGDVVAFDANGRFSVGSMSVKTVMPGQAYAITLSVSEEYLTAPDTVYPVRIDPTIEISDNLTGSDAILDASIYQLMPNTNANWPFMHCGYYSTAYGIGRIMVQLPGLLSDSQYFPLSYDRIQSATFYIREATGKAAHTIQLRAHTGNNWTESGATWNSVGSSLGPVYATASVGPNAVAEFDITNLVIDWIEGMQNSSKGFVLTHSDENNATKGFCSSEYTTTGYRPYVRVDFTDNTASSLNKSVAELKPGDTERLVYSGVTGTVTWFSDNPDVATVNSSGLVTAICPGTAVIIASAQGYTARRCTVHVSIENGIYKIRNEYTSTFLTMKDGQIGGAATAIVGNYSVNSAQYLGQLWQVTYIRNGEYSLRPLLNKEFALNANTLSHLNLVDTSIDGFLQSAAKWRISANGGGFSISNASLNYVLRSPNSGNQVALASFDNSDDREQWYLDAVSPSSVPVVMMFFDTETGWLNISSYATDYLNLYVTINETTSVTQCGLRMYMCNTNPISPSLTWSSSDSSIVSVRSSNGDMTGFVLDETIMTATYTNGTTTLTVNFNVNPIIADGTYQIQSKASNKYVDIKNQNMSAGTIIHQWDYHGGNTQKWVFTHIGDGIFTIHSANSTTKYYLGVSGDSTANDQAIVLRSGNITDGMKWRITQAPSGAYKLIPLTGEANNRVLALDVGILGANFMNGDTVQQRDYVEDTNFKDEWYLLLDNSIRVVYHYDTGFSVREPDEVDIIRVSHQNAAERFESIFGIEILPVYSSYTSACDECRIDIFGDITMECLDVACSHTISCMATERLRTTLIHDYGQGNDRNFMVLLTGHRMADDLGDRSNAVFASGTVIITLFDTWPLNLDTNMYEPLDEDERIEEYASTLVHEISHLLGAPDHYCYSPGVEGGCANHNCDVCQHHMQEPRACIMSRTDNMDEISDDDLYCDSCLEIISDYLDNCQ